VKISRLACLTFFSITLAYCITTTISFLQMNLFLIFLAFGMLFQYEPMYVAFGFQHEKPVLIGLLVLLQFIFSPYNAVSYVVSVEANNLIASFCNIRLLFSTPSPLYAGSHCHRSWILPLKHAVLSSSYLKSGPILLLVACLALHFPLFYMVNGRLLGVVWGLLTKPIGAEYNL